jgi:hypothetical protein
MAGNVREWASNFTDAGVVAEIAEPRLELVRAHAL